MNPFGVPTKEAGGTRAHKALHAGSARSLGTRPKTRAQLGSVFRGDIVDNKRVRSQAPLPETPDELCEVARQLDVPEGEFLLGSDATETRLKDLIVRWSPCRFRYSALRHARGAQ
jgi:hypothetical protein